MQRRFLLSGGCGTRSWRGEDNSYLDDTCTEGVHDAFFVLLPNSIVIKLEADDDSSTVQALRVVLGLQEDSILIVGRQRVYLVS